MGKALHISLFACVFFSVLIYLGNMQITQNKNIIISGLYNDVAHARDKDLDEAKTTFSVDKKVVDQKKKNSQLIKDGIFWSDFAESFVPAGSSVENSNKIVSYLRSQDVKSLTTANKTDCGDLDNGIAVLRDGTRICVRHRPSEFKIQGDALAFQLSRMLKMDIVPEMFLTKISNSASLWRQLNISTLPWKKNETVGMIKWIPDASHDTTPRNWRDRNCDGSYSGTDDKKVSSMYMSVSLDDLSYIECIEDRQLKLANGSSVPIIASSCTLDSVTGERNLDFQHVYVGDKEVQVLRDTGFELAEVRRDLVSDFPSMAAQPVYLFFC